MTRAARVTDTCTHGVPGSGLVSFNQFLLAGGKGLVIEIYLSSRHQ